MLKKMLDHAINLTVSSFRENPANYIDERSLAEDLRVTLNRKLDQASADIIVSESSRAEGDVPDHREYTGQYEKIDHLDRVQCEIGGPQFPLGDRDRIDLVVFKQSVSVSIHNGTQGFHPSDLAVAIAFKYVKNINYLRYRPDNSDSKYHDLLQDIKRLGRIVDRVDHPIDARCLVISNYDLIRREDDEEAEIELMNEADARDVDLSFHSLERKDG